MALKDYKPRHMRLQHSLYDVGNHPAASYYLVEDHVEEVSRAKEMDGLTVDMFRLNVMLEAGVSLDDTPAMRSMSDLDLLSKGESVANHIINNYIKD